MFQIEFIEFGTSLFFLIFLLLFSGVVSASEVLFFSLDKNTISENKEGSSIKNQEKLFKIINRPDRLLSTILIWNNFLNILIILLFSRIVSLTNFQFQNLYISFFVDAIGALVLILFFGELLPKVYAKKKSLSLAFRVLPVISFLVYFSKPMTALFMTLRNTIKIRSMETFDPDDVNKALSIEQGIPLNNSKFITNISKLNQIEVKSVMLPRNKICYLKDTYNVEKVKQIAFKNGFSRMPVIHETLDEVIGVLHLKSVLSLQNESHEWIKKITKPLFIADNTTLDTLLYDIKNKETHLGIVRDEYGVTQGIITLEDVIEEIVGDISDEFDATTKSKKIFEVDYKVYEFEGNLSVKDFCEFFKVEEGKAFGKFSKYSETMAGVLTEKIGRIPMAREIISIGEYVFSVKGMNQRRIEKIRFRKK